MLTRCEKCNGQKTYMGIGGMRKDCDTCHGIGQIEKKRVVENLTDKSGNTVPARKRGRKPKSQQEVLQAGA